MDIFISWSGGKSGAVARILGERLPDVIQSLDPFVSSEDIGAGQRWSPEIAARLDRSAFGIICVTADNQHAPWINFEAGTLAKAIAVTPRVVPLLVDLSPTELTGPLTQFQAKTLDRAGFWDVVQELNKTIDQPLAEPRLERAFDGVWTSIEEHVVAIRDQPAAIRSRRDSGDVLDEILTIVRELSTRSSQEGGASELSRAATDRWLRMRADELGIRVKPMRGVWGYVLTLDNRKPETLTKLQALREEANERGVSIDVRVGRGPDPQEAP